MALESTALNQEVQAILTDGPKPVHYFWRAEIIANDKIVNPLKVLSIDIVRDYVDTCGDQVFLEIAIGAGTFDHLVFPFKENLVVTLFRDPIGPVSQQLDLARDIESQPMRATLLLDSSSVVEGNTIHANTAGAGDLTNVKAVKMQLVDVAVEQLRMLTVGLVLRKTSTSDALKYILTQSSGMLDTTLEDKIEGVDMYPSTNLHIEDHIVIPHGTRLIDVGDYLQVETGGIYNAGLGVYLQKKHWYVYPLYDIRRFDNSPRGLTLINVPKNRLAEVERTYRLTPNQVIVLVTGETKHKDDTERLQLNHGNGLRYTDADALIDNFSSTTNNRTTILRAGNNNEFVAEQRKTGLNNVQMSPNRITSNTFAELSRLARRAGAHLQCAWENSDPGLIWPGMPVRYLYTVANQVKEMTGVVIGAEHHIGTYQPGLTSKRHVTNTALTLFVGRAVDWTDV